MNNIKLFMLLIMAATSSVAIADDNTWEFDSTTEPGTLVIKGKGDLTTAYRTTGNTVFTPYAVGYVYTAENEYSSVASGGAYNVGNTYYYAARTFDEVQVPNGYTWPTFNGVNKYQIWKDNCTNVYKASLTDEYTWNIAEGTNLYAFLAPKDLWNFEGNVYNVTYKPYDWTSDKGGNRVYKAFYNDNNTTEDVTDDYWTFDNQYWGLPSNENIYNSSNTYTNGDAVFVYIDSNSNWWPNYGDRTTNGTCEFVPSSWVISDVITIGAQVNNGSEYPGDGDTFDYNNTYYKYVTSTSPLTSNTTYQLSSLAEGMSLISDMSAYHGYTTVNVKKQTNGEIFEKNTATFQYDGRSSLCYATSSNGDLSGAVALSELTLIRTDEGEGGLRGYYTSQPKLVIGNAVSEGDTYTDNGTFYYNSTYVGYVKLSAAYDSGNNYYPGDEGVTPITSSDLTSTYLQNVTKYTAGGNLYRTTTGKPEKIKLTEDVEYTLNEGDHLWKSTSVDYTQISDNGTFFGTTHPNYVETEKVYFKDDLLAEMVANGSNYTKVEFVNTGSGELTINSDIVHAILYPNIASQKANGTIEELDMGKATMISLNSEDMSAYDSNLGSVSIFEDFLLYPDMYYVTPENLEKVTLPLVRKNDEEMVLPSLNANIPSSVKTVTVPDGYTKVGEFAFFGCSDVTHVNLPENLTEIGDYSFYLCDALAEINITNAEVAGRKIVLPSTVQTIGDSAFKDDTKLVSTKADPFILPESLVKIEDQAFVDCQKLAFLEFNEGLTYIGNSAFALQSESHAQTAITFPSTIKYLGPASFHFRQYQDIYFTSQTAPVCPIGLSSFQSDWGNVSAFDISIQNGNNGFNPLGISSDGNSSTSVEGFADNAFSGYANRENYINNGYYLTLLHFPENLSSDQAETFRDITRRYVTGVFDENGNFDYAGYGGYSSHGVFYSLKDPDTGNSYGSVFQESGNLSYGGVTCFCTSTNVQPGFIDTYLGAQAVWPSQAQWMRNFITVANGLKWDGTTEYLPELTEDMFNNMKADGLVVNGTDDDTAINLANKVWSDPGEDESVLTEAEKKYLSKILYQGTRRFVLSYDSPFPVPFKQEMETGKWYSFCVPFNMTKKEVDDIFGVGTHVCLFSGVERTIDAVNGNKLVLKFKNDVYRHVTERSINSGTQGGFTYTYEKNFSNENIEAANDETVVYARQSYMIFPMEDANDPAENDDVRAKIRNFGSPNFETGDPLPTIVYSNSSAPYTTQNGTDPAYRFIGNFTTTAGYETNNNVTTAVSVKIPKYSYAYGKMGGQRKFFILNTDKAAWSPFKSIVQNTAVGGGLNDWNNFFQKTTARVNQISLFGDDEEVTGIDNVIIEVSSDNDEDLRVFNLNGSQMGNSLQGLPAGTYIQGGKAYRVK